MIAQAIKTRKVTASACTIFDILDESLESLHERSVLVVTSKVVSLCEGRILPVESTDLPALVQREAEWFMPDADAQHGYTFTIAHNMLTPNSGVDESNSDGVYTLWPADPWASASAIRSYLKKRFGLRDVAVIIADSTFLPLRWGAIGLALSYSGLEPVRSYSGKADLFGRPLVLTRTNVVDGLAATATFLMGEGAEQTPLAVIEDVGGVTFVAHDPTPQDIAARYTPPSEDSFGPLLTGVEWREGGAARAKS